MGTYFEQFHMNVEVRTQWPPFEGEPVDRYSPRVDLAIGPFADQDSRREWEYDKLTELSSPFLNQLLELFRKNSKGFSFQSGIPTDCEWLNSVNPNARCFICIEIERIGTRKHRIGDIINACSLGRVGVIIAWDRSVLESFLRIAEYFTFLRGRGKPTCETRNLVVVSKEQFRSSIP